MKAFLTTAVVAFAALAAFVTANVIASLALAGKP